MSHIFPADEYGDDGYFVQELFDPHEVENWCRDNLRGMWVLGWHLKPRQGHLHPSTRHLWIEDDGEAMLFKLTFGGQQ